MWSTTHRATTPPEPTPPAPSPPGGAAEALAALAALEILGDEQRRLAAEAMEKLAAGTLYVAMIGEFKRGKSSLINALLGEGVLPTGVVPVTAVPTLVRFGPRLRAQVQLLSGTEAEIPIAELRDHLTEQGNPGNTRGVRQAVIEHPAPLLEAGLVLVDTPGTGSLHLHNTQVAQAFLPRVDVALLTLTVEAPLSQSEAALLAEAAGSAASIAVCLNKVDLLDPAEVEETLAFVRPRLADLCGGQTPAIFPISARQAMDGGDGGVAALVSWLREDVVARRALLVRDRARQLGESLLSVAQAAVQLERAAASRPAQQAQAARRAFETARSTLATAAGEEATLLRAAFTTTIAAVVEPRVDELSRQLPAELLAGSDEQWPERVAAAAARWRDGVGAALTAALAAPLERHAQRLEEHVTRFVEQAGEAYGVQLPVLLDPARHTPLPPVRVELADEPGALAVGIEQLRRHAPGAGGRHWRERARGRRAAEEADRLAGRLRYAAVETVKRSADERLRESAAAWQALSETLAAAVTRSEQAAGQGAGRRSDLERLSDDLEAVRCALSQA